MFTGLKDKNHAMRAEGLGVREYLIKAQFTLAELLDHIRRHISTPADSPATTLGAPSPVQTTP